MPSPFPGMDPYLEDPAFWPDFHSTFINYWREALADSLPEGYEARLDERVRLVRIAEEEARLVVPDLLVTQRPPAVTSPSATQTGTLTLDPVAIPFPLYDEVRTTRIKLLRRPGRKLIAVLELLSPDNKTGDGYLDYSGKRKEVVLQRAHLVELDLLTAGRRVEMGKPLPPADYYAFVSRHERRPYCDVYRWNLRDPLPAIPIPLMAPDPDVVVNLAEVFATTYERGRYAASIDYLMPPTTTLPPGDIQWATQVAAGYRRFPSH